MNLYHPYLYGVESVANYLVHRIVQWIMELVQEQHLFVATLVRADELVVIYSDPIECAALILHLLVYYCNRVLIRFIISIEF